MDTFRILLPSLVAFGGFVVFCFTVFFLITKQFRHDVDIVKAIRTGRLYFIVIAVFLYGIYVMKLMSVNDIPRATIERTLSKDMTNSFEERMKKDTIKH